jgi:hypothetical protein
MSSSEPTVLFERLDNVFELLSRDKCVFTCFSAGSPLTSRTAVSSSTRACKSWNMAGLTPVIVFARVLFSRNVLLMTVAVSAGVIVAGDVVPGKQRPRKFAAQRAKKQLATSFCFPLPSRLQVLCALWLLYRPIATDSHLHGRNCVVYLVTCLPTEVQVRRDASIHNTRSHATCHFRVQRIS